MTKFAKWVDDMGGTIAVAYHLKVSEMAVKHWLARKNRPVYTTAVKIAALSKRKLSIEQILSDTTPLKKK